ncbi:uncharacterized protein PRCAT00001634001 [Priceomyces carsonii]|uniref:uncharacterized protein n=1 Tax=Priceomyces carsonii TaxID=28549 RepID=UPI002ED7D340|nr:unnamed protein product [Priceomyces carsonii]
MDFSLSTYFSTFDVDKDYTKNFDNADKKLESVTHSLAHNPESTNYNSELFEDLIDLVHGFRALSQKKLKQLSYLISSSFNAIGELYYNAIVNNDYFDTAESMKLTLEKYGYLMYVVLKYLGKEDHTAARSSGRSKHTTNTDAISKWKDNCSQVEDCLAAISTVMRSDLSKLFLTSPERDLFIELFMRPIMNLMESPERMKIPVIKLLIFKIICISAKTQGQASVVQHYVIQSLTYYVHLSVYMAELLHTLAEQYDYSMLTEEILREISQTQFNSNDSNGPKAISEFLVKLSELNPKLILKQLSCISQLLDNSNQTLRSSVVEACGNIIVDIAQKENHSDQDESSGTLHIDGLLDLLQKRFLDQNPYVRAKAFQAICKVLNLNLKLSDHRQSFVVSAVRSLDDRSTLVRRNAIKLMSKLVLTHQFNTAHGSQLSFDFWKTKLDEAETKLTQYLPISPTKISNSKVNDSMSIEQSEEEDMNSIDDIDLDLENEEREDSENDVGENGANEMNKSISVPDTNELYRAKLQATYYKDAVNFINAVQEGTSICTKLLFSKNRNEALESMDFLVLADAYGIENAADGIRKMLHLVWMKGTTDEGKSVPAHLIDCYRELFLTAPSDASNLQKSVHIAKNLIGLTFFASVADLASLEKLLCLMYDGNLISNEVINVLWQIYNYDDPSVVETEIPDQIKNKRRGAIIILGMLALADYQIAVRGLDMLLSVGLMSDAQDLSLAKYSCIALQRMVPHVSESQRSGKIKIPRESDASDKLVDVLLRYDESPEWYGVAEQAVSAIFEISSKPDVLCADLIKEKANLIFKRLPAGHSQSISLSQLLFIVGHVAVKTIVFLERLETDFKKKKHESEAKKSHGNNEDENQNELEMIGGTSEDDFSDAIIQVKEREILYGSGSLLARFGRLVREICSNNNNYDDAVLQRSAVLCMVKLMCVSSIYCEENLQLLLVIMQKSPDPVVRCNCVLGLGDMAVCFNNLVDESTDYLYGRLNDENIMVQRTCLMTVTFLILAGQVKVKGQLSSMAKCLENPDQGISDMCRLFFAELATKDNAIYNGFIDIFSGLSSDESLSKDAMKRIIRFLLSFIDKEKQQKQLSEKLFVRLSKCQSESQWNDIAFVLNAIPYKTETISLALEYGYKLVQARQ